MEPSVVTMSIFLRFAGPSNSGKTTAISTLAKHLRNSNHRLAILKHSHHDLEISKKDSEQLFLASSEGSVTIGGNKIEIHLPSQEKTPKEWSNFLFPSADIILVEGWRKHDLPTILLQREPFPQDWLLPKNCIAVIGLAWKELPCFPCIEDALYWIEDYLKTQ